MDLREAAERYTCATRFSPRAVLKKYNPITFASQRLSFGVRRAALFAVHLILLKNYTTYSLYGTPYKKHGLQDDRAAGTKPPVGIDVKVAF